MAPFRWNPVQSYIKCYWNPRKIHSTPIEKWDFSNFNHIFIQVICGFSPIQFHLAGRSRSSWSYGFARAFRTRHQLWGSCAPALHQVRVSTVKIREGPTEKAWNSGKLPGKTAEFLIFFFLVVFFWLGSIKLKAGNHGITMSSKKHTMSFGVNDRCRFSMEHLGEMMASPDDSCYVQQAWLPCWCSQFCSRHLDLKLV